MPSVLIVDDDRDTRSLLSDGLRRRGYDVHDVESGGQCLSWLQEHDADVIVTDVQMPGMSGVELCELLCARHPNVLSIVLTGIGTLDTAIAAIRSGAYDFVTKPTKIDALEVAIGRAFEHLALTNEARRLRSATTSDEPLPRLIGASRAVRAMITTIRRVADSAATVMISGESGTGKELVARSLHELSSRRGEPFVAINCGAVPPSLLESELFGHARGAFTDAKTSRMGLFQQAGSGTILLDEIGEMPMEMQVKLLRVLQERTVRRVGEDDETPFSARVLTATNRDLETEIEEKRFREDLYYRINVVEIAVPPLRDRGGDVMLLAEHLLASIARRSNKATPTISANARRKLLDYDWPGNVRELENCIERACAISQDRVIDIKDLPPKIQKHEVSRLEIPTDTPAEMITLDEMVRTYVRRVLASCRGNKTHAARVLGIDRRSLYRQLESRADSAGTGAGSAGGAGPR